MHLLQLELTNLYPCLQVVHSLKFEEEQVKQFPKQLEQEGVESAQVKQALELVHVLQNLPHLLQFPNSR